MSSRFETIRVIAIAWKGEFAPAFSTRANFRSSLRPPTSHLKSYVQKFLIKIQIRKFVLQMGNREEEDEAVYVKWDDYL